MRSLSVELKVGIFALIVLAILSFMTIKVGKFEWFQKRGYTVYIYFDNIAGLDRRTKVKIAGVEAGVIDNVLLEGNKAKLKVRMYEGINLYSDSSAFIKFSGFLGDKFLEIRHGSTMPLLKDGDTIINAVEVTDIDGVIRKFSSVSSDIGKLSSSINEIIDSEESRQALKESIINLRNVTQNMNQAIVSNDTRLRKVLGDINELSASLNELMKTNKEMFNTTMVNLNDFSLSLKTNAPPILKNLNETTEEIKALVLENRPPIRSGVESINRITGKIERGEGTLGKLLNDDTIYESANRTLQTVNKTMSAIDRFRAFVTLQGEYLSRHGDWKGHFSVTLQPKPENYLIFGVVDGPVGQNRENKVEFSAQMAKRFKDSEIFKDTALRAGLTENTLGFGIDQFLLNDRLKLSADVWDFGLSAEDAKNPHFRVGVDYFTFKNLFISAGFDDIFNNKRRSLYFGGGVRFGN
ncbi:MAG: MlaD family protein [Thermodesulfovibrionales bacterium]|nr:MlaD family protein [Thermodesulfovibrionales bacterium]